MQNELFTSLLSNNTNNFLNFLLKVDSTQLKSFQELDFSTVPQDYAKALILKISNLLIGRYQYKNLHDYLISKPYALIIDPANNCPLHCPGCLHNKEFQHKIGPDWPSAILTEEKYSHFMEQFGPYATSALFYNWGEPLLNQKTPSFIKLAKSYLLETSLSSNLSVNFDAEALVLSGLDYMILSVDGATKETYELYRKGGQFDLVIENIRRLVAVKRKYDMATPWLSWQFLLFEHNKHEIERAKNMAIELGVNEIRFARPYDVLWDSKLIPAIELEEGLYKTPKDQSYANRFDSLGNISSCFKDRFAESWADKLTGIEASAFSPRTGKTCLWLYTSLVMDAANRFFPCCYAPRKDAGFTYSFNTRGNASGANPFNTEFYRFSRQHFGWLSGLKYFEGIAPKLGAGHSATYCTACQENRLKPLVNDTHLKRYLEKNCGIFLMPEIICQLSSWND